MTLPALFIAHGAPDLPLSGTPARAFTEGLGKRFPGLRAIVVVSAHWEARQPTIGTAPAPETVHDFGGFDERKVETEQGEPAFGQGERGKKAGEGVPGEKRRRLKRKIRLAGRHIHGIDDTLDLWQMISIHQQPTSRSRRRWTNTSPPSRTSNAGRKSNTSAIS